MTLSPHQKQGRCQDCIDGASDANHCAWCGIYCDSVIQLDTHMDDGCTDNMLKAMLGL